MHGIPRQSAGDPPAEKKRQAKVAELQSLQPVVLHNHHICCYTKEALRQNARLLELNPEFYTAWNYRKRAVQHLLAVESNEDARKCIAQVELDLVLRALNVNPKSYGAWYHRKWVIGLGLSPLDFEFVLLKQLLKVDARNFQGWNYRRFAGRLQGVSAEAEIQFTTAKINENFSNYSAWHNRSALLSQLFKDASGRVVSVGERLEDEYKLVINSFFTDPNDQSGWFYYSWLLGQTVASGGPLFNGSWPPSGSHLSFRLSDDASKSAVTFSTPFKKVETVWSWGIPLILCFNEPVTGVNNQTVAVHTLPQFGDISKLTWTPVSFSKGHSRIWATNIAVPTAHEHQNSSCGVNYQINIEVAAVPGILSLEARSLQGPVHLEFTAAPCLSLPEEGAGGEVEDWTEGLVWPCKNLISTDGEAETSEVESHCGLKPETREGQNDIGHGDNVIVHTPILIPDAAQKLLILEREIGVCQELLELEPDSKWAKLTLARLLLLHNAHSESQSGRRTQEVQKLFEELTRIDPPHAEYYRAQQSLLLMDEVNMVFCIVGGHVHSSPSCCSVSQLVLHLHSPFSSSAQSPATSLHNAHSESQSGRRTQEVQKLFEELTRIDPPHAEYYRAQQSLLLMDEVTANINKLEQQWGMYPVDGIKSSTVNVFGWLRLSGLSLATVGCSERLLWVQRLDLSNNHLHSTHGLETLQLLVSLDLSHNKISQVAALAPLRLLPLLTSLNVSFNEIGAHGVDTCRALFPSVLTNYFLSSSGVPEQQPAAEPTRAEGPWEVGAVFHGMGLRVLEIAGNPVQNDDDFSNALLQALPSLKFLDGQRINQPLD